MATIDNNDDLDFGDAVGAVTVSQYRATFDPGGTNEISTGWVALNTSRSFVAGDDLIIPAGDLNIQVPRGVFPEAFSRAFADHFLAAVGATAVTVELGHSNAEITDTGYSELTGQTFAASDDS